jgi:hypothetical protein
LIAVKSDATKDGLTARSMRDKVLRSSDCGALK